MFDHAHSQKLLNYYREEESQQLCCLCTIWDDHVLSKWSSIVEWEWCGTPRTISDKGVSELN